MDLLQKYVLIIAKKRKYIPSWNTFFEKSSPFVQNFCIYTPSKSVAKCGEFQPKTANLGIVCLEQSKIL
jgi:hypothetical protein